MSETKNSKSHSHPETSKTVSDVQIEDDAVYTCPMHPEVCHPGPGACPLCGMGLEPESVNLEDEGPNPELVDFTRRLWVGVVLSVPLLVLSMSP